MLMEEVLDVGADTDAYADDDAGYNREEAENKALQLSLHSIMGMTSKNSLKLWGNVRNKEVVVLIDCGASHNFINSELVQQLKIPIVKIPTYFVEVGDGHKIKCMGVCKGVILQL